MEKALVILRKASSAIAAKKADRELGAGAVSSYVHSNGTVGAMLILACETDFVANNPEFVALGRDIAMHIAAQNPSFLSKAEVTEADTAKAKEVFAEEAKDKPAELRDKIVAGKLETFLAEKILLEQPFIKEPEVTIQGLIERAVQKFGEKIEVREFRRFSVR
jgi:elongation factor Ts